jgi:hypothetical protein
MLQCARAVKRDALLRIRLQRIQWLRGKDFHQIAG